MSNVYEIITEKVLRMLEAGVAPWRKTWSASPPRSMGNPKMPAYRGINVFLLVTSALEAGYVSPYWITYRQAQKLGGQVRKGEKGTVIVFWKQRKVEETADDGTTKTKIVPCLRYYRVFNVEQCDGLTVPDTPQGGAANSDPIAAAEAIIAGYMDPPKLVESGHRAMYSPLDDRVTVPPRETFETIEDFYSTVFHELGHSTGHVNRLDRLSPTYFGSHEYGREELVAEMTATFLASEASITITHDNSAAYLNSWMTTIGEDVRAVVVAAAKAQRAADHILGRSFGDSDDDK